MTRAILWLRRDLRLDDNPALQAALQECKELIPLYICNSAEETTWAPGAASRWWLHHSLNALDDELQKRGSRLIIREGESLAVLQQLIAEHDIKALFWPPPVPTSRSRAPAGRGRCRSRSRTWPTTGCGCRRTPTA